MPDTDITCIEPTENVTTWVAVAAACTSKNDNKNKAPKYIIKINLSTTPSYPVIHYHMMSPLKMRKILASVKAFVIESILTKIRADCTALIRIFQAQGFKAVKKILV